MPIDGVHDRRCSKRARAPTRRPRARARGLYAFMVPPGGRRAGENRLPLPPSRPRIKAPGASRGTVTPCTDGLAMPIDGVHDRRCGKRARLRPAVPGLAPGACMPSWCHPSAGGSRGESFAVDAVPAPNKSPRREPGDREPGDCDSVHRMAWPCRSTACTTGGVANGLAYRCRRPRARARGLYAFMVPPGGRRAGRLARRGAARGPRRVSSRGRRA